MSDGIQVYDGGGKRAGLAIDANKAVKEICWQIDYVTYTTNFLLKPETITNGWFLTSSPQWNNTPLPSNYEQPSPKILKVINKHLKMLAKQSQEFSEHANMLIISDWAKRHINEVIHRMLKLGDIFKIPQYNADITIALAVMFRWLNVFCE